MEAIRSFLGGSSAGTGGGDSDGPPDAKRARRDEEEASIGGSDSDSDADGGGGGGGDDDDLRAGGYEVFRLHGVLYQPDRRAVYKGFAAATAGVLLCTDVGARGLDFTGVGATVQVDPPCDPTTYVHRVGRTARLGREGEAVLFLQPRETEYANVLSELGVKFCAASVPAMLDVLDGGRG